MAETPYITRVGCGRRSHSALVLFKRVTGAQQRPGFGATAPPTFPYTHTPRPWRQNKKSSIRDSGARLFLVFSSIYTHLEERAGATTVRCNKCDDAFTYHLPRRRHQPPAGNIRTPNGDAPKGLKAPTRSPTIINYHLHHAQWRGATTKGTRQKECSCLIIYTTAKTPRCNSMLGSSLPNAKLGGAHFIIYTTPKPRCNNITHGRVSIITAYHLRLG